MSFASVEGSRQKGSPVSLYLFVYGDGPQSFYAYTDAEQIVNYAGVAYQPIPIDRGSIASSGSLDKAAVEITTSKDVELATLFRIYPPSQVINLFIRQGHIDDGDFLVCWTGRVLSCSREDNETHFSCEPISTSLKRNGLRRPYQYACPHVLYGPQCRANRSAATTTIYPIGFSGVTLVLPENWTNRPQKYIGGMVQWTTANGDTVLRTILNYSGTNVFALSGPVSNLPPGSPVNMILGCNHQTGTAVQPNGDCLPLHGNIHNFGGQPWIPLKNPIGLRSQYY